MYYFFFFAPIGTDAGRSRIAAATIGLIGANLLVFLLTRHLPLLRPLVWQLAMIPAEPHLWTALSACFLHAGWWHLGGNMLYLGLFGPPLEDRLGWRRFLLVYVAAGVFSLYSQAAVIMAINPRFGFVPVIGASGAVAGLLGAFLVRLPFARVRIVSVVLFLLHGVHRAQVRHLNSVAAIGLWMILQLAWGLSAVGRGPQVAYWAHLGGMGLGAGLAVLLGAPTAARAERRRWHARRYLEAGAWYAAAGELEAYLRLRPDDRDARRQLGRTLVAAGARRQAVAAFRAAIGAGVAAGALETAIATYLEMERLLPGEVLPPAVQLAVARGLLEAGEFAAALTALDDLARAHPELAEAELARLLRAEIHGGLLGEEEVAVRLWREIDPRRLPPRWRRHLAARLQGHRAA